jgi:hypothetical protein
MPQRMIPNEYLTMLEKASPLKRLRIALDLALQWKAQTGMTHPCIKVLWQGLREDTGSVSQTVMASNAPMLLQRAMVDGRPAEGVMSSGQVAALIGELRAAGTSSRASSAGARADRAVTRRKASWRTSCLISSRARSTPTAWPRWCSIRPPVNALNALGWFSLAAQIAALGEDPDVRVIVIRAEGRGFCAGVDIKELDADQRLIVAVNAGNYATFKAVHRNPVPVIAAVHGFVLGGGIGICGAADIVIAAEDASLSACPRSTAARWAAPRTCSACSACRRRATCSSPAR